MKNATLDGGGEIFRKDGRRALFLMPLVCCNVVFHCKAKEYNNIKVCPSKVPVLTYNDPAGEGQGTYSISLCTALVDSKEKIASCDAANQSSANICQDAGGVFYSLGSAASSASMMNATGINGGSIVGTYRGGSSLGGCKSPRYSIVTLFCNKSTDGLIQNFSEGSNCQYSFVGGSKYACVGASCGCWSCCWWCFDYGYIIIICFVLLVITYLVLGGIYQFYKNEARGIDIIPNLEFWKALPFLIKDGFIFTIQKISMGRLCSDYTAI